MTDMEVDTAGATEEKQEKDIRMDVDEQPEEKDPLPDDELAATVQAIIDSSRGSDNLTEAIDTLLQLEKKNRQKENEPNTLFVCKQILELCRASNNWDFVIEQLLGLSKRRSQFRPTVKKMVRLATSWLDATPSEEIKIKLLTSLRDITEGKIFLEVERAELTLTLAEIRESKDDIIGASDVLQELQIETFGSLTKHAKCNFLLEQFRLCLRKRDFIRANIVRNKITDRVISGLADLELKYWKLSLILFFNHEEQYMKLAKAYQKLMTIQEDQADKINALQNMIMAIVFAKYDNEQHDMLHRTLEMQKQLLDHIPVSRELLTLLTTKELIGTLPERLEAELNGFRFDGVDEVEQDFSGLLRERFVQHNIRVIAEYYSRISSQRLSQFLRVDGVEMEKYLSDMVTSGQVFARIDRLSGIVRFVRKKSATQIVNDWRSNIDKLLSLVDKTCHQIHKEQVVHAAKSKGKKGR